MFDCRENRLTPDVRLGLVARFELHPTTLLVLDALVDHDLPDRDGQRKGLVWPKVERLALLTRRCERTVQYHLRRLERLGLISSTGNGGRSRPATVMIHWAAIMGEPKRCKRPSWPARETAQRVAPARKQEKQEKQAPVGASAGSPDGPPPRRGFWSEEAVPPPASIREALHSVCAALTRPVARTLSPVEPTLPSRMTDRVERDRWQDDQMARAKALGLR